jgi:ribosome maturation factor RimP
MGASRPFFVMATVHDKEKQLYREISRSVSEGLPGVEVLAVELTGRERFCVYVDAPGGVDHALCERVSGVLRPYLDRYAVEVSSPGIERPLRTRGHFERAVGRRVRLKTPAGHSSGEVQAAGERFFTLAARTGEPVDIPYDAIVRANLIDEG